MPNPYVEIFRAPGAKGFAAAGFVARMPMAMAPIGIVAMLSQTHGEFWLAGAVSATYAFANALFAPQISRVVDRLGQSRVLIPTTLVAVAAFAVLMLAAAQHWPIWTLFAAALAAAVMPSFPAMIRTRWSELFRDRPELNTAFAFESSADELVYIAGASLSVGLAVALFPEAGLLASTLFLALGGLSFIAQRGTEPQPSSSAGGGGQSAIRQRPVQIITLALVFVGAIFATAEVSAVAITEQLGVGALNLKLALEKQLAIALAVIAVTAWPLLFVDNVPMLALAVFMSGIAISPTFITAFGLIERRVPAAMLTEGITWVMTGIGIGMALGSFVTGWVVDTYGASHGFIVSVVAGALALLTVLLGQRTLAGRGSHIRASGEPQPAE
ncbi:MFS transporter [Devosia sp.]|uniref:MFS transporter n=1 Tax=Devosia sp. TaxID=1871048 RepID=UPI003F72BDAF